MSIAVYPGSFDPFTVGHQNIAERACRLFDKVVIAVARQNYKNTLFGLEERKAFIKDAVSHLPNIEISVYNALTVEVAKKTGASAIIRGLRAISDYEYEMQVAAINKHLDDSIETIFLMANAEYTFISSSMIKQVCGTGGKITGFVTPMVEAAMRKKLLKGGDLP